MATPSNVRTGILPRAPFWTAALDASRPPVSKPDEQTLEILAKKRNPKKVAEAALAASKSAFGSKPYQHFRKNFLMAWEMVRGQQWPSQLFEDAPSWRVRVTRNKMFGATQQIAALMMDILPEGHLVPERGAEVAREMSSAMRALGLVPSEVDDVFGDFQTDREKLDAITRVIQAENEHRSEHMHLSQLIGDMVVGGLGVEKIFWNADERVVDARQIYPLDIAFDPECKDRLLRGMKFMVQRKRVDIEDVIERYDPPKRIRDQLYANSTGPYDRLFAEQDTPLTELYPELEYPDNYRETARELVRDQCELYEVWYTGLRSFELEHPNPPTGDLTAGRVVVVKDGLDEPLYDGPNPDPRGELPYVFYRNYGDGRDPYGYGEVEPNLGNQIALNIISTAMTASCILNQNGQWLHEEGAWTMGTPDNRPGGDYEVARGMMGRVQRLPGVDIPQTSFQLLNMLDASIMDVTRVNDTTFGAPPQTHTPAHAIQLSQTMNMAGLRRKGQDLGAAWKRRTRLQAQLTMEYAALLRQRGERFEDLGEYLGLGDSFQGLKFDVRLATKVEMPVGIVQKVAFAAEGMQHGFMDELAALDYIGEYPTDPGFRRQLEIQRDTALKQAEIENQFVSAQHAQVGVQGAPAEPGQTGQAITAGVQPAGSAGAGPPAGQESAPVQAGA